MPYNIKGSLAVNKNITAGETVQSKRLDATETINLPLWSSGFDYVERDVVSFNGETYTCISNHTSTTFNLDTANWKSRKDYSGVVVDQTERLALDDCTGQTVWQTDGGEFGAGGLYFQILSPASAETNWVLIGQREQILSFDSINASFDSNVLTFDTV